MVRAEVDKVGSFPPHVAEAAKACCRGTFKGYSHFPGYSFSPPVKSCSTFCLDEKETGIGTVVSAPSVSWLPFGQLEMLPYFPGPNVSALPFVEIFSDS